MPKSASASIIASETPAASDGRAIGSVTSTNAESRERPMNPEQRQRMRDDVRDAYRKAPDQPVKTRQQMSPEQREKLRQDIRDANKDLRRL